MLNILQFHKMLGLTEQDCHKMQHFEEKMLNYEQEFVQKTLKWLEAHQLKPRLKDLSQALAELYRAMVLSIEPEAFHKKVYQQALKWHNSGLNQTELTLLLAQLRHFVIQKGGQLEDQSLAQGYCNLMDIVVSIFNTIFVLMGEVERIRHTLHGELKRFERSFHLLGLTVPKSLIKPYVDHQMWKVSVLELAMGIKQPEQLKLELDPTKCSLGIWLKEQGLEKIPEKERARFVESHNLIHKLGQRAIQDAQNFHPEHILTYFNELEQASDALCLTLLNLIEDEFVRLATSDHLTGLPNRRAFDTEFKRMLAFAERYHMWMGILVIDIDHFKKVNDIYGHLAGDQVLHQLSEILQHQVRTEEHPYRWGGEEFAILLLDKKPGGAKILAERIRQAVEKASFQIGDDREISITISVGALCFKPPLKIPMHEIFAKVDKLLYQAKIQGRNQVVHEVQNGSI